MRAEQLLQIQLTDRENQPLLAANILIDVQFFVAGRLRYTFVAGRTASSGNLVVTYDDLEAMRRDMAQLFLMDFNTRLEDCDPTVNLKIPSQGSLITRHDNALRSYQKAPRWAEDWPSNSEVKADGISVELHDDVARVDIV